jgi:hypothetical protein
LEAKDRKAILVVLEPLANKGLRASLAITVQPVPRVRQAQLECKALLAVMARPERPVRKELVA